MNCRELEHRLVADIPGQPVLVEHLLACRNCRDVLLATRLLQQPENPAVGT